MGQLFIFICSTHKDKKQSLLSNKNLSVHRVCVLHPINTAPCPFGICICKCCKNSLGRSGAAHKTFYHPCTIYYANGARLYTHYYYYNYMVNKAVECRLLVVDTGHFCCGVLSVSSAHHQFLCFGIMNAQHILWHRNATLGVATPREKNRVLDGILKKAVEWRICITMKTFTKRFSRSWLGTHLIEFNDSHYR